MPDESLPADAPASPSQAGPTPPADAAPLRPDLVDQNAEGRVVLGFNAPAWGADASRIDDLMAWAVRAAHAGVQAASSGTLDLPAGADLQQGYDIAFISAFDEPEQADDLVLQLTDPLADFGARPVWMVHDPDAGSRLRRANTELAELVQPLAAKGQGMLLWASVVGEHREFGLNNYIPRTQTSTPYTGEVPASLERAILAHKRAHHDATGRAWVGLRAIYQPDDLPPIVQTDLDSPLPWTTVAPEAWDAERRTFPARD